MELSIKKKKNILKGHSAVNNREIAYTKTSTFEIVQKKKNIQKIDGENERFLKTAQKHTVFNGIFLCVCTNM